MTERIEIVDLTLLSWDRPLKAIGSVRIGNLTIHGFRIVQETGERAAVLMPTATTRGNGGQIIYRSLLSLPSGIQQIVEAELFAAWHRRKENESSPSR